MSMYRRRFRPGAMYFFTIVTENRAPLFSDDANRALLHRVIEECRIERPFDMFATVLLPDHWHALWRLPDDDTDYSTRIRFIKTYFTRDYLAAGGKEQPRSTSRKRRGNRGVWQRRFWEHVIRDVEDQNNHVNYIHYNAVKHGYVKCPHEWKHSSFSRFVENEWHYPNWYCSCGGVNIDPPDFSWADEMAMECE